VAVIEDYPSANDTWTVTTYVSATNWDLTSAAGTVVIAVAYCLTTPNYPLDMTTVSARVSTGAPSPIVRSGTGSALCPPGSVLTGGGYRTGPVDPNPALYNAYLVMSAPTIGPDMRATGWQVGLAYPFFPPAIPETTVFARCATRNLSASRVVTKAVDVTRLAATYGAWGPVDVAAECPKNSFTTGGGYWIGTDPEIPHFVEASFAQDQYLRWRVRPTLGYDTRYPFRACDPSRNPDCDKTAAVAACVAIPNIPIVKVKIISPANGASFRESSPRSGLTAPITFTAQATDEQGATLTGSALRWTLNGAPFGVGESFNAKLPVTSCTVVSYKVRVTATGRATSAYDEIIISTGQIC
jgi:hypothetical protein